MRGGGPIEANNGFGACRRTHRVRRSLSMPSSKDEPSCFFLDFMKSATMDLDWPKLAMVNEPTLFRRITCGIRTRSARRRCAQHDTINKPVERRRNLESN